MKKENDLELRVDRRDFTLAAMLAMLGGVSITISGCGKASSPSSPSMAPEPAPPVTDKNGVISNNHGHVAVVTGAQLTAASTLALNIQGTSSHNHVLELSGPELAQIREGRTLTKECSSTSHSHMVTFN